MHILEELCLYVHCVSYDILHVGSTLRVDHCSQNADSSCNARLLNKNLVNSYSFVESFKRSSALSQGKAEREMIITQLHHLSTALVCGITKNGKGK